MKKTITAVVVAASAVAAPAALAAIDDAGMRYISASEGFGGSLRVKLLSDTNKRDSSVETSLGSTRLYIIGEGDMGNGLTSTYYWEWRVDDKDASRLKTDSVHVGLKGVFGAFQAGHIEPVGSAMLPSPDLTNDVGVSDQKLNTTGNHQQAMRWISPKINGLQFGVSAGLKNVEGKDVPERVALTDTDRTNVVAADFVKAYVTGDDDTIDSFDLAVSYDAPRGFKLGASYESRAAYLHSVSKEVVTTPFSAPVGGVPFAPVGGVPNVAATYGLDNDAAGFRLAGSYGRDSWQIAYNYRAYNHVLGGFEKPSQYVGFLTGHKETKYTAHSFGGTVGADKFTFGFGYQLENLDNDTFAVDLGRETFSFDVGYSFTSKAKIIAAFSKTFTEEYTLVSSVPPPLLGLPPPRPQTIVGVTARTPAPDVSKAYLLYRIDF